MASAMNLPAMLAVGLTLLSAAPAAEPAPILPLPVRVHLMQSTTNPKMHTTLTEADVQRIFGKVNKIWSQAGIRFEIESIRRTQALDQSPLPDLKTEHDRVKALIPKESLSTTAINVCYVKEIQSNGFHYGDPAVVKDTAVLMAVENGMDEPIPRVTAHELGHALGLRHRQDTVNLMASKTSGYSLNETEIQTARRVAKSLLKHPGTSAKRLSASPDRTK